MSTNFGSTLGVFAHPDDESLASGGLLAAAAAAGFPTSVVTATWTDGTHRALELAQALTQLGSGPPHFLGYADVAVPESAPGSLRLVEAPLDEAVSRLVAHIRAARPELVVTHDAYGGVTGHPDHVHTHRLTVLAAQAAGLVNLYPDAGDPWQPSALLLATHPDSAMPLVSGLLGERRARFSVADASVTDVFDATEWLDTKVAAILSHRSEVERGAGPGVVSQLSVEDRIRLLSTEWYIRWPLASLS